MQATSELRLQASLFKQRVQATSAFIYPIAIEELGSVRHKLRLGSHRDRRTTVTARSAQTSNGAL